MKEGYKKTELGEIPNEWNIVKTDEILINDKSSIKIGPFGSQLKKEFLIEQGYKVYGQENVFKNDFTLGNRYINKERYEILKSSELKSGDLVISMMGTVGKTAIVPEDIEIGIMDSHLIRLRVDESKYSKELLRQMIQNSPLIKKQIKKLSVGGIMEGLSSTIIKQLKFPLINLKEQEKIAEILSTVDGQIDDTEMLIEKCQELKKGLMQRFLTKGIGHTEFKKTEVGEIPVDWEVKKLNECGIIIGGNAFKSSKFKVEKHSRESYQVIRMGNVQQDKLNTSKNPVYLLKTDLIDKEEKYILKKYDVLISLTGTVNKTDYGNVAEIKEDDRYLLNQRVACIRNNSDEYINKYLYYIMKSTKFRKQFFELGVGGTGNQANVSINDLSLIKIPIPSVDEQQKIVEILSGIDNEIEEYEKKKQNLEELKKGLMQQLLKGKIRTV